MRARNVETTTRRAGSAPAMTRRALTLAGAVLFLAGSTPPAATAQEPEALVARGADAGADVELLRAVRSRAERAGFDEASTARLMDPAVAAAESGLPSGLLLRKTLEGLSKGVPPDRVVRIVSDLREAMTRAASVVDPALDRPGIREAVRGPRGAGAAGARDVLVESAALALSRGAGEEALGALLDRVGSGLAGGGPVGATALGVGMETLASVSPAARSPEIAAELVATALGSGFGPTELRELPAALEAAQRRGQLPAEAAARGAIGLMRADIPAAAVLQNLFDGDLPAGAPSDVPPGLERARDQADRPGPP